jgi:hypothetical protein
LHVVELHDAAPARAVSRIQHERTFPVGKRLAAALKFLKLASDILLVLHVASECVKRTLLKIDSAVAKILSLITKESPALLHRIHVPNANAARHICNGKSLDGEPTIHRLSADKYPAIRATPINLWRLAGSRIHLFHPRLSKCLI